jgi:hypothetical protein
VARESPDGDRVFPLLVRFILQGSNYEQKRAACKCLYDLENLFMPNSQKLSASKTDVDIYIRRLLDPQTSAEFFGAMEPKSPLEEILDRIQETDVWKGVLFLASDLVYWIRKNNCLRWIFQPELRALIASLAGKTWHLNMNMDN